jgi:hypothetical protein
MIYSFIEFGGVLFWSLIALLTLVLAGQVSQEKTGYAILTSLVGIGVILAFTTTPIIATVKEHPIYVLYGVIGYFVIAGLWAIVKWRAFFLPALFEKYDELRSAFLKEKGLNDFPADPAVRDEFNKRRDVSYLDINNTRMVRYNKGRVTTWMVFWPWSIIGTFFGDFLYRVFTTIYKGIHGMLQAMSDKMASQYSELN